MRTIVEDAPHIGHEFGHDVAAEGGGRLVYLEVAGVAHEVQLKAGKAAGAGQAGGATWPPGQGKLGTAPIASSSC